MTAQFSGKHSAVLHVLVEIYPHLCICLWQGTYIIILLLIYLLSVKTYREGADITHFESNATVSPTV